MRLQKLKRRRSQDEDESEQVLSSIQSEFESESYRNSPRSSPRRSSYPPSYGSRSQSRAPRDAPDYTYLWIILIVFLIIVWIWLIIQAIYLPQTDHSPESLTDSASHFNTPIDSVNFDAFTIRLHAQCRYAYSHHSSNLGDIRMTLFDTKDDGYRIPFLRFLTFSDYGIIKELTRTDDDNSYNIQGLLDLIQTMNSHLNDAHFIVSAGDHFYENNVDSATHPRWNVLDHFNPNQNNKVFLSCPGNKDWKNESDEWNHHQIQAQIERTQFSTNWCLPRLYYTVRFVFIDELEDEMNDIKQSIAFTVRLIALDTTSFLRGQFQSFHYDHYQYLEQQYQWLQEVLRDNEDDDWIIVFGHHPLESVPKPDADSTDRKLSRNRREHRFTFSQLNQQAVWKKKMKPILELLVERDNVISYISGHHHIWRVCSVYDEDGDIRLLSTVTGCTGRGDFEFNEKLPPHMLQGGDELSFGKFTVHRDQLTVEIIDKFDHVLFTQIIRKKNGNSA